jgi:hypothetical protein
MMPRMRESLPCWIRVFVRRIRGRPAFSPARVALAGSKSSTRKSRTNGQCSQTVIDCGPGIPALICCICHIQVSNLIVPSGINIRTQSEVDHCVASAKELLDENASLLPLDPNRIVDRHVCPSWRRAGASPDWPGRTVAL